MQKLSATYRNDPLIGLPRSVKEYLDEHFLQKLENLSAGNPKLLVVFSGGNALGKSTLSHKISEELQGLVIENDAIKTCLLDFDHEKDRENLNMLTWQYSMDLYSRLGDVTPNGLIVKDGVIDWYFDRILPIFEAQGYGLFIIGFDISERKRRELIMNRGDKLTTTTARQIELIKSHDIHTRRFREHYTPDIILTDETLFKHDDIIMKLREKLQ